MTNQLRITWKRMEKGPRGGGGGIAVFANGMLALVIPDSPLSERLMILLCAAPDLLRSLNEVLPLAEDYLKSAPSHPDNGKLMDAKDAIAKAEGKK
jgi:hypothetical protein